MNMVMKYFISLPVINWKRFLDLIKSQLSDFTKVDEAISIRQQSEDQRMHLNLFYSGPKM